MRKDDKRKNPIGVQFSTMKSSMISIAMVCASAVSTINMAAQANDNQTLKTTKMEAIQESKEVVQGFFTAFGKGDFNGIINSFHDSCTIVAVRNGERNGMQIHGTYKGKEGAKSFISNLGHFFDTKAFSVDHVVSNGDIAFANGTFMHLVKSTGKLFSSDWALMCVIKDDQILEYHFYEDSAKFLEASN